MIRFSVMTSFGWWDDGILGPRELLARLAAHGAGGVEVCADDFLGDPALARQHHAWLAETGLQLVAVDVLANLVHRGARARQAAVDALRRGLDVCVEQGAPVAHCVGSRLTDGVPPADGRKMIADLLAEQYDPYTSRHGVTLAIENYGLEPELICRRTDCLDVLQRAGNRVRLVFDTGNFIAVGERAEENLEACLEWIVMCHVKDWTANTRPATAEAPAFFEASRLGEGVIDNPRVAAMLVERGFNGWVSLESCRHAGETVDQTLARELALLRRWFAA
jgi:sugar phosphate isomerase/epimerase